MLFPLVTSDLLVWFWISHFVVAIYVGNSAVIQHSGSLDPVQLLIYMVVLVCSDAGFMIRCLSDDLEIVQPLSVVMKNLIPCACIHIFSTPV